MKILVTGALGYIGSHTVLELLKEKHEVILVDNLSNSSLNVLNKINKLTSKKNTFEKVDIRDTNLIIDILTRYQIDTIFHFAGLKSIPESLKNPNLYLDVNVNGTKSLLVALEKVVDGRKTFIFSSSAAVYGNPKYIPIDEEHDLNPISPYGISKMNSEEELKKTFKKKENWSIASLRYFNPIGSESSYQLGDYQKKRDGNLMSYIGNVGLKKDPHLKIYGDDYNTNDGTGVRDFIHIQDLVEGHISALKYLNKNPPLIDFFNLGTGKGCSVLELINQFKKINNINIPYEVHSRREGDLEISVAQVSKAKKILNWKSKKNISDMCFSAWKFILKISL